MMAKFEVLSEKIEGIIKHPNLIVSKGFSPDLNLILSKGFSPD